MPMEQVDHVKWRIWKPSPTQPRLVCGYILINFFRMFMEYESNEVDI